MGAQNMPCSEMPPKLWMQLSRCPQRCREDSLESFPGAAGSDSVGSTWISSRPVTPELSQHLCQPVHQTMLLPPVQSSQGHQDSREEVTGEEVQSSCRFGTYPLDRAYLKPLPVLPWGNALKEMRRSPTSVLTQVPCRDI